MTRHEFPDELLHAPAVAAAIRRRGKFHREKIEQRLVRRRLAGRAEIIHALDDPETEDRMPHAVHDYACRERIRWRHQPLREFASAAFLPGNFRRRAIAEHRREAARYALARLVRLATRIERAVADARKLRRPAEARLRSAPHQIAEPRAETAALRLRQILHTHRQRLRMPLRIVALQRRLQAADLREQDERPQLIRARARAPTVLRHALAEPLRKQLALLLPQIGQPLLHPRALVGSERPADHRRAPGKLDEVRRMAVLHCGRRAVARVRAEENARHRVVLTLRDGVELVVVTARARNRHTEDRLRDRVDLLVRQVEAELPRILLVQPLRPEREKARRHNLLRALPVIGRMEQIARDLLAHKLVERLVRIQRCDHVVAVTPRMGEGDVHILPAALRIARHVQPVPPPALAELRRCQQPVHPFREHCLLLRRVRPGDLPFVEKFARLLRRRRQPGEVEENPAQHRRRVRVAHGRQALCLDGGEEKTVHIPLRPRGVLRPRHRLRLRRLERPPLFRVLLAEFLHHRRRAVARVRRAHFHPLLEVADHRIRQLPALLFRRHREVLVGVAHRLDEQALVEASRHHRRPAVAAAADALARVEHQAALHFRGLFRVALVALLREHRADLPFKKIDLLAGGPGLRDGYRISGIRLLIRVSRSPQAGRKTKRDWDEESHFHGGLMNRTGGE